MVEQQLKNLDGPDPDDLTVVYAAATATDANFLVNQLAEAGIRAVVTNAVLEGGSGVDILGWPTLARVAVAKHDAQAARAIALDFDRTVTKHGAERPHEAERPQEGESERATPASPAAAEWPRCPECNALRATRCPICSTEGTDFRQADPNYTSTLGLADDATPLSTCGCGSGSCHGKETPDQTPEAEATDAGSTPVPHLMLLCPTCDEPFEPQYARRCTECGHDFAHGFEVEGPSDAGHFDYRVVALIAIVLAIVGGLLTHFALIVPGR